MLPKNRMEKKSNFITLSHILFSMGSLCDPMGIKFALHGVWN